MDGGGAAPERPPAQRQPGEQERLEQDGDCMRCRVVGTGVCLAASAYLATSNWASLPAGTGRAHRVVMLGAAAGFLALGIARALV